MTRHHVILPLEGMPGSSVKDIKRAGFVGRATLRRLADAEADLDTIPIPETGR